MFQKCHKKIREDSVTIRASLVAQKLKPLPAMWETWVRSLGQEDPLEKEMATHSSILAWRIPWTEEPGGLQSTGSQRVGHDWATSLHFSNYHKLRETKEGDVTKCHGGSWIGSGNRNDVSRKGCAVLCCAQSLVMSNSLWPPRSPPGSSVHGILQARILETVAMPSSRGSSQHLLHLQHCRWILYPTRRLLQSKLSFYLNECIVLVLIFLLSEYWKTIFPFFR